MHFRNKKRYRLFLIVCAGILVLGGCGKVKTEERTSEPVRVTPTAEPKYEPKNAADLARKTADELENLQSVHMELSSDVRAELDLLGTILGGFGNIGTGESFVPDLGSILGTGVSSPGDGTEKNPGLKKTVRAAGMERFRKLSAGDSGTAYTSTGESGEKESTFSMELRYAADIQGNPSAMYFRGDADVNIMGKSDRVPADVYYFEEGDEHAVYSKAGDRWERQTVQMESLSPSMSSEFFKLIADGTVHAGLSDMSVEVNGRDTYRMNVTISGENIGSVLPQLLGPFRNAVENNETLHQLFGASSEIEDVSHISLPIRIYIDRETFYPVQMRMEMAEFGQELFNSLSTVKVKVDTFDTIIDYSRFNETSVGKPPV